MSRRGYIGNEGGSEAAAKAQATADNARQMVLNRGSRFTDLAALVSQLTGNVNTITTQLSQTVQALADNTNADAATRAHLTKIGNQVAEVDAEIARLDGELDAATAQLAAADEALTARIIAAETALKSEATIRAAADAAEALARAQADAAEAKARADADTANQAKQDAAIAAEAAARAAADTKEAADRAAADTALAARVAALENYMPAVTSGRATRTALTIGSGATIDIPVAFDSPATDTNYVPVPVIDAPTLSSFTPTGFKNKTTTGVTVTLRANAAITLAITLNLTVIALKL